jgi:hypothetical protein
LARACGQARVAASAAIEDTAARRDIRAFERFMVCLLAVDAGDDGVDPPSWRSM